MRRILVGVFGMFALVAAGLPLLPSPAGATAPPTGIKVDIDGCDLTQSGSDPSAYNPDAQPPDLVCDDQGYVGGNLGKNWNELDLVPFRINADAGNNAAASSTYTIAIVVDHEDAGHPGYDVLSVPVLNSTLSSAGCTELTASGELVASPGLGGIDESLYRLVTITQPRGSSCVYDYYARLAVGSHLFPGSSLHANLATDTLDTGGVGAQDRSIPVNEILPQELDKDMTAVRDADHVWNVTKEPTPAQVDFEDTCSASQSRQAAVSITVEWERLPASPNGDVTITTNIYATNPAARSIVVNVTDQVFEGNTQTTPVGAPVSSGNVTVPKNTANFLVLTHQFTAPSTATEFNDVATATYLDLVTGVPVPGQTEATASATVQTGATTNTTATITDVESITGAGFSYSVDSFSGASGAFDGGYVAGTVTTGDVSWTSTAQSGNGSVTFTKTIYVTAATSSSGSLDDTATLVGSDGFTTDAEASVTLSAEADVSLTIDKTIPIVLDADDDPITFTFHVSGPNGFLQTETITFGPGDGGSANPLSVTLTGLEPGEYTVSEETTSPFAAQDDQTITIALPACEGSLTINNLLGPAVAQVQKVTDPVGNEVGWSFDLVDQNDVVLETVTTTGAGAVAFATVLEEGPYTIVEQEQTDWDSDGGSTECAFTVDYPADADRTFSCTYTNTQRGRIIVVKQTEPDGSAQSFEFDPSYAPNFSLTDGQTNDSGPLVPGSYSVSELVPSGWDLVTTSCDDGSLVSAIGVAPGETVTCTFTNRQRGHVEVVKTVRGAAPSGTEEFTFQLRQGATPTQSGTTLETSVANAGNGGTIEFATNLVPAATYQLCEIVMPGWSSNLGTFVPDSFLPPDGVAQNPNVDNSIVCVNFSLQPGETKTFTVDNTPPPGGRALTIGFWKNWASCSSSNGGQDPVLDQVLASFPIAAGQSTHGVFIGDLYVDTCLEAVRLLNKADVVTAKKQSSSPFFNLASQLMAAKLNVQAGAGTCGAALNAINAGQALLDAQNFIGRASNGKMSGSVATQANNLANTLDRYNNNLLC